jgi:CRP/FNR family transcriptional regulator, cyclic AMP receptor protein
LVAQRSVFSSKVFLSTVGAGRQMLFLRKGQTIYVQGDPSDAIFVIQEGWVTLSLKHRNGGRDTAIDIRGAKEFVGIDSVVGQPFRIASAVALTESQLLRIEKKVMLTSLADEVALSRAFIADALAWIIRCQQELVDQRTNTAEKRLARILLRLSRFDGQSRRERVAPKVSQEFLSEMVGTTSSRISFFMNRFREAGYINYEGGDPDVRVRQSLSDFCAEVVTGSRA